MTTLTAAKNFLFCVCRVLSECVRVEMLVMKDYCIHMDHENAVTSLLMTFKIFSYCCLELYIN